MSLSPEHQPLLVNDVLATMQEFMTALGSS